MIEFAGETFESTEDIQKRFESIRDTAPLKEPLQGTEHKMVMKLLQMHPRYKEKIGPGISALTVDYHPEFKTTRVFTIVRIDKLKEDFSFQKPWRKTTGNISRTQNSPATQTTLKSLAVSGHRARTGTEHTLC